MGKERKVVIDDLQTAELAYKRQINAFEDVYQVYHSLTQDGYDRRAMHTVLENMRENYSCLKRYRTALTDIVDYYAHTERSIMQMSAGARSGNQELRRMNTESVKKILNRYNIKIV